MAIQCTRDKVARRVRLTIDDGTTGRQVADYILAELGSRPELIDWDWVQDVRDADGEADNADMNRVAEAFAGAARTAFTVFVSTDPALPQWTRVMDHVFARRRHYVVDTPEAATRLLDRLRAS